MNRVARQHGFVLLPVVLAITLVAVIAFMLNNKSAVNVDVTAGVTDSVRADQVARAGLAHATWGAQYSGCAGDRALTTVPFGPGGVHSYSTTIASPGGGTTTTKFYADQDTWIDENSPDTNHASDITLLVQNDPSSGENLHGLLRFDLSSLPAGTQINSAVAGFFVKARDDKGSINLHRVTAPWTETDATWDSMAGHYDPQVEVAIPPKGGTDTWVEVNLTPLVQAWVNGALPNNGILLQATSSLIESRYISREGAAGEQPYLRVVTGTGPASPVAIASTGTLAGSGTPPGDITRSLARTAVPALQPQYTLFLQPGPEGKDARIYQWKYAWNYGANGSLTAEAWPPDSDTRSLLQFDLDGIPRGARIHSASLSLHQNSSAASGGPFGVHRITSDWVEGSGNGGTAPGVTWNERDTGTPWATPGGDMDAEAHAITTIPAGMKNWYSWDITGLVDGWVNGRYPNQGVALIPEATTNNNAYFDSSDTATVGLRPKLTVTYACECGRPCLAPQGSGTVLMAVSDDTNPTPEDVYKRALFESWGYTVIIRNDNSSLSSFNDDITNSDVIFISDSVDPAALAGKLAGAPIGIVNEEGLLNDDLGISNNAGVLNGAAINVTDASHYITAPFAAGALEIYDADMEQLVVFNGPAPDLQTLADVSGYITLATLEKGAALKGGATAPARRVMLPFGRDANKNWDYINANGLLILQRALQWGTGNTGDAPPPKNLLFVAASTTPTAQEQLRIDLIESWGYTVTLIDDSDSQANFDAAVAANDVAYVSSTVSNVALGSKLLNASIGVVDENMPLAATFGFATDYQAKSRDQIRVTDNTHYITSPLAAGYLTIFTTLKNMYQRGSTSGAETTLADSFNVGSDSNNKPSLIILNPGDALDGGGTAAGRRVQLPWGDNTFDVAALNADGLTIMQRAIEWAEGAETTPAPTYNVLLVVGDAITLSSKDTGYKALMESWGHSVTLIDDGDSQANFDAAAAANDVVYVSGSSSGPSLLDKLTNTTTGLVNEVNGKIDNFGFSSITSSTINYKDFTKTDPGHHITAPFSGNPVQVFQSNLDNPVPGGTLAPDLHNVGEVNGTPALVTLDIGATRWDGNPSPERRAHLPFAAAEAADLTADGETILQRAIEWAAGVSSGGGGGGGGGGGDTVTLTAVADNRIEAGEVLNRGGENNVIVGQDNGSNTEHALVQFDLSSLPAGSTITGATLRLNAFRENGGANWNIDVHRVTEAWTEMGSNWNQPNGTLPWSGGGGGSYDPAVEASLPGDAIGWFEWDVTALVQAWYGGTHPNHGVILVPDSPAKRNDTLFDSREGANPPELVITYTTP